MCDLHKNGDIMNASLFDTNSMTLRAMITTMIFNRKKLLFSLVVTLIVLSFNLVAEDVPDFSEDGLPFLKQYCSAIAVWCLYTFREGCGEVLRPAGGLCHITR